MELFVARRTIVFLTLIAHLKIDKYQTLVMKAITLLYTYEPARLTARYEKYPTITPL